GENSNTAGDAAVGDGTGTDNTTPTIGATVSNANSLILNSLHPRNNGLAGITKDVDYTQQYAVTNISSGNASTIVIYSRSNPPTGTDNIAHTLDNARPWAMSVIEIKSAPKTWDGGAGTNNWGDAANWNPDGVPTSTEDVSLTGANTININLAASANNLTLNNATLTLTILSGNSLTVSGSLTLAAGTLNTEASFPSVTGTVSITGGTVGYTAASGSQTVAVQSYVNLTISGGGTKTLAGNITPSGDLSISGGTFDLSSYSANRASAGGTLTVSNAATVKIGGTGTIPSNYSTHSIGSASTIEYAGTTQTVATLNSSQNYGNLTISGSGTKTLAGNVGVEGDLTISAGTLDLSSYTVNHTSAGGTVSATNLTSGGSANAAQSSYSTASITPSANKLILLAVAYYTDGAGATISSVTGNGLTWVQVASTSFISNYYKLYLFRAMGSSPSTGAVTINFSVSDIYTVAAAVNEFGTVETSGTNGSGAIVQSATYTSDGTTSLTVTLG
ncbi:MAG: hypothetical protein AAB393_08670, partial [Bacteroidota bacterium]